MVSALLLGGALVLGQPPAEAGPPPEPIGLTVEVPPAPPPPAPAAPTPAAPPDRWPLMRALQGTWYGAVLDDRRVTVSGWVEAGFTGSTNGHDQLPEGFNYRVNAPEIQQNWLRIDRAVDPTATAPTWGFRSDTILPGVDYRFSIARGLLSDQLTAKNGTPNLYGIDPVQFYGELYLPDVGRGLDVKVGRFYAQYGVESVDTTQNALVSRSYNFVENPFTHTGLLATQKLSDAWTVQNGLVTGSDMFVGPEANPTYIGSAKWAPPAGRDSVLVAVIAGGGRYNAARAFSNPELLDLVYAHKFSDRLSYTVDALYSFQHHFPGAGASGFVNDWGVAQYLTYQFAPTLAGTVRAEVFGDPQGQRTGTRGIYQGATAGLTHKPRPWLWVRPELRYDHCDGRPFEGRPEVFSAACDFVARW